LASTSADWLGLNLEDCAFDVVIFNHVPLLQQSKYVEFRPGYRFGSFAFSDCAILEIAQTIQEREAAAANLDLRFPGSLKCIRLGKYFLVLVRLMRVFIYTTGLNFSTCA
jgi:hypothetical protein